MSRKTKCDVHAKRKADDERRERLGLATQQRRGPFYNPGIVLVTNPLWVPRVFKRKQHDIIVLPGRGSPAAVGDK